MVNPAARRHTPRVEHAERRFVHLIPSPRPSSPHTQDKESHAQAYKLRAAKTHANAGGTQSPLHTLNPAVRLTISGKAKRAIAGGRLRPSTRTHAD